MATLRLKTVKPSGGDYTSVASAISGEAGDLVTADEYLHIEVHAGDYSGVGGGVNYTPDTGGVTVIGFTTDATRYVAILAAPGSGHDGQLKSGGNYTGIAINRTNLGDTVVDRVGYLITAGMTFDQTLGTVHTTQYAFRAFTGAVFYLSGGNIYSSNSTNAGANGAGIVNQNGVVYSINDFFINPSGTQGGFGFYMVRSGTAYSLLYNATIRNFYVGVYVYPSASYDNIKVRNTIATGCATDYLFGSIDTIWDSCVSGDGTMTSSLGGTVTNDIANGTLAFAAADSCEITSGATSAIDNGADLSSDPDYPFSTDILGVSRPQGSGWDRGAWELVAAAAGTTERARTRARGVRRY